MIKKTRLDSVEQALEDQFETLKPVKAEKQLIDKLRTAAQEHIKQNKKPVTIRLSVQDLEAIKIKAAKRGLPYQTYINMLIHMDALNP